MRDDAPRLMEGEILPPETEAEKRGGRRGRSRRWDWTEEATRGKPPSLNPDRLALMLEARRQGSSVTQACAAIGIDRKSHQNWMKRGQEDDAAGRHTLYAEYFRKVPLAAEQGRLERKAFILRKIKKGGPDNIAQAKAMLAYEVAIDSGRIAQETLRLKREALKAGVPSLPAPSPNAAPAVDASLYSPEEWKEFEALEAKARADFAGMTPAEVARFQELLRKGRGQDTQDESTPG